MRVTPLPHSGCCPLHIGTSHEAPVEAEHRISAKQRKEAFRPKALGFWANSGLEEPPSLTSYRALDTRVELTISLPNPAMVPAHAFCCTTPIHSFSKHAKLHTWLRNHGEKKKKRKKKTWSLPSRSLGEGGTKMSELSPPPQPTQHCQGTSHLLVYLLWVPVSDPHAGVWVSQVRLVCLPPISQRSTPHCQRNHGSRAAELRSENRKSLQQRLPGSSMTTVCVCVSVHNGTHRRGQGEESALAVEGQDVR